MPGKTDTRGGTPSPSARRHARRRRIALSATPRAIATACCAVLCLCLAGCQWKWPQQKPAPVVQPSSPYIDDPCAERMHNLCGWLFEYYAIKHEVPATLDDLRAAFPTLPPMVCPKSGRPYVYDPVGLEIPDSDKRVIVYDSQPCHDGRRWVVVVDPMRPGRGLVTDVKLFFDGPIFRQSTTAPAASQPSAPPVDGREG